MSGIIPVLLYHSVTDESAADRFAVSCATFKAHIDAIEASGRVTLQISDVASALHEQRAFSERIAVVSFDDGYADTYDAVYALLDRGLCSTVYITTGEVGAADRLTHLQVAELARISQIEIGAHAVRHRYLDELDDSELVDEVELSKSQLEEMTQVAAESFAYPHGAYDSRVRTAVIEAGYSSAVAVKNALSHTSDDPFAIARWTVTANTPAARIAQVLEGENVPRAWSGERARTRAYRTVRRARRSLARMLAADS